MAYQYESNGRIKDASTRKKKMMTKLPNSGGNKREKTEREKKNNFNLAHGLFQ